jgi:uroporphyrinogen decarboxylase
MREVAVHVPADRLVLGNIDPAGVFRIGTVEDVRRRTFDLLNEIGYSPNFVLSSGCDIPAGTPLENIDAFFGAVLEFNSIREKQAS